jgi:putative flavoprotein involved in K+ transport
MTSITGISSANLANDYDVVVIGAGQAGLSVGYHLKRAGLRFAILERATRVGDGWRKRWDSLRLFTPARYDGLVGMPFPAPGDSFPTKDEMADYLESYARHFELPVHTGVSVERLERRGTRFAIHAGGREILADQVVVAAASYQRPRLPRVSADLDAEIVQLHSSEYKNPSQLRPGGVLLVGAGNSGSELATELSKTHRVWLSGRDVGEVPFRMDSFLGQRLAAPLVLRFVFHHVLTVDTPMGRKARPTLISQGGPLIRVRWAKLAEAGVTRAARVAGVKDGRPLLDDGTVVDAANVVWCTGFDGGFSWIDLPIFDDRGEPRHASGLVPEQPGLYFVGLHFQHSFSSGMIHGVARDAARIAGAIGRFVART